MRHQKKGRQFGRIRKQKKGLVKTMMGSLIRYGKIKLTEAKAKELRPKIEKIITKAKKGGLAERRAIASLLPNDMTKKVMEEIALKYKERNGGYTRIIKLGQRRSDSGRMAIIEFV